jgi:hypothetical protein
MNATPPEAADRFELWRPRVTAWLLVIAALLAMYWLAWFADCAIVASDHSAQYVSFEQSFPLADTWLLAAVLMAAVQRWRRQPSASMWLIVVGGAGVYLGALDTLYDLQHGIYAKGRGGAIELAINVITVVSSIGVIRFGWGSRGVAARQLGLSC